MLFLHRLYHEASTDLLPPLLLLGVDGGLFIRTLMAGLFFCSVFCFFFNSSNNLKIHYEEESGDFLNHAVHAGKEMFTVLCVISYLKTSGSATSKGVWPTQFLVSMLAKFSARSSQASR